MLPTSGQANARAVRGDVDVLVDVGAVESQRVVAGLAFHNVAAIARVPDELVVAVAQQGDVVASAAGDDVIAGTADEDIRAGAAGDGVVAVAAVDGEVDRACGERRGVDRVVAAERPDDQAVVGALGGVQRHLRRQARDGHCIAAADNVDCVFGGSTIHRHGVGCSVSCAAARQAGQIDGHLPRIGAGQVVDSDVVGTAPGVELDGLDPVHVHGHVADVTEEAHARAIRGDVDVLVDVGAVEQQRVGPGLTFHDVAAIARVPYEGVVARAQQRQIVAAAAGDQIVAVAAQQNVGTVAAGNRVIARAAIE